MKIDKRKYLDSSRMYQETPLKVIFFHRKPSKFGHFSVEFIFQDVRKRLEKLIDGNIKESKYHSSGFIRPIYNLIEAPFFQGDINHVTGDTSYLAIFLKKSKTLLTILDCVYMERNTGIKRILLKYFFLIWPIKRAEIVTVISESTKNEILRYVNCNPDKIKVIPVAISPKFKFKRKDFTKEKPVILQIGVAQNKNINRLIDAIKNISCRLEVVGKLPDSQIEKLRKHNIDFNVSWNLSQKEVINKYINCDILAFVSTYEGFGMPILEANAIGRVVLTSNLYSMPQVGGNAVHLIDPYDINSIKEGIIKLINDDAYRNQLIKNGLKNIKRFDPDKIALMYYENYNIMYKASKEIKVL